MNLRYLASKVLDEVTNGRSLSECLEPKLTLLSDGRDRALVQAIAYGACRFYFQLDFILSELLSKPMKAKDSDVHALLMVGLYQLMHMRIPEHAAVSETVNAVSKLKKPWARGLVNGVLRDFLRKKESLLEKLKNDEEAYFSHPYWMMRILREAYPEKWEKILFENNQHPPFSLRVNASLISREAYLEKVAGTAIPETLSGITLNEASNVLELPGFYAGEISVQDGAAQLAAEWLDVKDDQRILDACSAPGGKLTHILTLAPKAEVVAIEKDKKRLETIKENLARLKQSAKLICADASDLDVWWDKKLFDRILLDAPCSASGVIRRHPDIKLLHRPDDIKSLAEEQKKLLNSLWQILKPGGKILYATCSLFPAENQHQIDDFLKTHLDAALLMLPHQTHTGRQILPGDNQMDGFYYALIEKEF